MTAFCHDLQVRHRRDQALFLLVKIPPVAERQPRSRLVQRIHREWRGRLALGVEMPGMRRCRRLRQRGATLQQHISGNGKCSPRDRKRFDEVAPARHGFPRYHVLGLEDCGAGRPPMPLSTAAGTLITTTDQQLAFKPTSNLPSEGSNSKGPQGVGCGPTALIAQPGLLSESTFRSRYYWPPFPTEQPLAVRPQLSRRVHVAIQRLPTD